MDAKRFGFGAIVEWLLAAACVLAVLAAGALALREVRSVTTVTPVIARGVAAPAIVAPAAIPPGAISLPFLVFTDGKEVRVGESVSDVVARIGRGIGIPSVERGPNGERVTRVYEYRGRLFQLVFEPFATDEEPRLVAIYR